MKLYLKNIGKIDEATIQINGITVIAGENDTGKSTVGRALFSVFNSFHAIDEQIRIERIKSVRRLISSMYGNITNRLTRRFDTEGVSQDIIEQIDLFKNDIAAIKDVVVKSIIRYDENFEKHLENVSVDEYIQQIREVLNVSDNDILKSILEKSLDSEFNGQISNIYSDAVGEIQLEIKNENTKIFIEDNSLIEIENSVDLLTEIVYLDDPFVLDEFGDFIIRMGSDYKDHRIHLKEKLLFDRKASNVVEEIIINNKFENIYHKIATVCNGDIIKSKQTRIGYKRRNSDEVLDVRNLSTGLKTFVILKMLLLNGTIAYNGTIILDEPEIHLHPEWQLLFAELIVLMQKEFNMHILLNTHSPYFLRAIQVYSARYEMADRCKYYLSENVGSYAHISDVTNDIERIYSKLSKPLQRLEDERWQDD